MYGIVALFGALIADSSKVLPSPSSRDRTANAIRVIVCPVVSMLSPLVGLEVRVSVRDHAVIGLA